MALPRPEIGLVISYSFLWRHEAAAGQIEGRKSRPSAILLSVQSDEYAAPQVTVAPITHSTPSDLSIAVEIPTAIKAHLGLDAQRSWVILNDLNVFFWPGPDLTPIQGHRSRFAYGLLPPSFFRQLVAKFVELRRQRRIAIQPRTD